MFKSDIGLRAHIDQLGLMRSEDLGAWGSPQDLHHDGLLGGFEGFHCLLMCCLR